jgi:protease-4
VDGIGVLEVNGVLAYRPDLGALAWDGVEDSAEVIRAFRALEAHPAVAAIVLNVNSPGGFAVGGAELADAVFRSAKPTVAWAGGLMCSLAYWIGSQADTVLAARSAQVGSIGAYLSVVDVSRMLESAGVQVRVFRNAEGTFKGAGLPGAPISDEHAAEFTRGAQRAFDTFRADVLRARPGVGAEAMRGQVFDGGQARDRGLVDALGDLDYARAVARFLSR